MNAVREISGKAVPADLYRAVIKQLPQLCPEIIGTTWFQPDSSGRFIPFNSSTQFHPPADWDQNRWQKLLEKAGITGKIYRYTSRAQHNNPQLFLLCPVHCNNSLEGVLVIEYSSDCRTTGSFQLLKHFLKQLPHAIENAHKFELLQQTVSARSKKLEKFYLSTQQDLELASKIQSKLLNTELPVTEELSFSIVFEPMIEVGGDLYDVMQIRPGYYRVMIADATGHGVQAAMITMLIKSEYDLLKQISISPSHLLISLNNKFSSSYGDLGSYFTGIVVDIDLTSRRLIYSSAGHPEQYLYIHDKIVRLRHNGRLIGVSKNFPYKDISLPLDSNANLLLFSDGIGEGFDESGYEYGEEQLGRFLLTQPLLPIDHLVSGLLQDQKQFTEGLDQADDITIVGVGIPAPDKGNKQFI